MPQYLVTGPQRSGTTIAGHILADKFKLPYVDEFDVDFNDIPDDCVIQAPFALKHVIELAFRYPKLHFIYVIRKPEEIIASMERIQWFKAFIDDPQFYPTYITQCRLMWAGYKSIMPSERWTELNYSSLESHPLFVKDRDSFTVKQWQPNKPVGPKLWTHDQYT
jgi:hypothetical protein